MRVLEPISRFAYGVLTHQDRVEGLGHVRQPPGRAVITAILERNATILRFIYRSCPLTGRPPSGF